jgi:hypothetical protein
MNNELANFGDNAIATVTRNICKGETFGMEGKYDVICYDKDGNIKWQDVAPNLVVAVGKQLLMDTLLRGSAYTVTGPFLGLIGNSTTYLVSDTMVTHTWTEFINYTVGGSTVRGTTSFAASSSSLSLPSATSTTTTLTLSVSATLATGQVIIAASGATVGTITTGATGTSFALTGGVAFGTPQTMQAFTPSTNNVTTSSASSINFLITGAGGTVYGCFLVLGTGAVNTQSSTAGVLYSAGNFTGGSKTVAANDTLAVTYSTTATS